MSFAKGFFATIFFLFVFYLFKVFGIIIFQTNGVNYINYACSLSKVYSKAINIFDKYGIAHINMISVMENNKIVQNVQFIAFKNRFNLLEKYLFYDKNAFYTINYSKGIIKDITINKGYFLDKPKFFRQKLNLANLIKGLNKKIKKKDVTFLVDFNTGFIFLGDSEKIFYIGDFI